MKYKNDQNEIKICVLCYSVRLYAFRCHCELVSRLSSLVSLFSFLLLFSVIPSNITSLSSPSYCFQRQLLLCIVITSIVTNRPPAPLSPIENCGDTTHKKTESSMTDPNPSQLADALQSVDLSSSSSSPGGKNTTSSRVTPHPASLPKTITRSVLLMESSSIPTDICIQFFHDRIFVAISQRAGTIGTFLLCQRRDSSEVTPHAVDYEMTNLLGGARDDALQSVYARQIMERLYTAGDYPQQSTLLLGVSLHAEKGKDRGMMRGVIDLVVSLCHDAAQ
jgi:hypothetical protein